MLACSLTRSLSRALFSLSPFLSALCERSFSSHAFPRLLCKLPFSPLTCPLGLSFAATLPLAISFNISFKYDNSDSTPNSPSHHHHHHPTNRTGKDQLAALVYPLVQVALGVVTHLNAPKYLPLRLQVYTRMMHIYTGRTLHRCCTQPVNVQPYPLPPTPYHSTTATLSHALSYTFHQPTPTLPPTPYTLCPIPPPTVALSYFVCVFPACLSISLCK